MARRHVAFFGAGCVLLSVLTGCGGGGSTATKAKSASSNRSDTKQSDTDTDSDRPAPSTFHGDGFTVEIPPELTRAKTKAPDTVSFGTRNGHAQLNITVPKNPNPAVDLEQLTLAGLKSADAHDITDTTTRALDTEIAAVRHGVATTSSGDLAMTATAVKHRGGLFVFVATSLASEPDNADLLDSVVASLAFDDGGSSSAASSSAGGGSASTSAAATMRDRLLALAEDTASIRPEKPNVINLDPDITTWVEEFPSFTFQGSSLPATTSTVSGAFIETSKVKGVEFLPFAVTDANGDCAGGIVEYNRDHTKVMTSLKVDDPPECRANTVAEISGY